MFKPNILHFLADDSNFSIKLQDLTKEYVVKIINVTQKSKNDKKYESVIITLSPAIIFIKIVLKAQKIHKESVKKFTIKRKNRNIFLNIHIN